MATTTAVPPVSPEQQPPPVNGFSRLIGVFFSPKATFEASIARRPSWVLPVAVMTLIGLGVGFALNQRVNWREVASKRIEDNPRASQLSPEQKEQQISMSAKISPAISYCIGLLAPILIAVIVGGIMLGAYNLLGGANASFQSIHGHRRARLFCLDCQQLAFHFGLVPETTGNRGPENPVATNLGAFLPDGTAKWLTTLGTAVDLFSFWIMTLIAMGFAAFNPKKIKLGSAFGIVLSVWAVYEAIRVGLAFIFS